jgi:F0F1-type ATP synthase membrane subunit c/vacuolar-type H+-ATPase subunit K
VAATAASVAASVAASGAAGAAVGAAFGAQAVNNKASTSKTPKNLIFFILLSP